MRPLANIRHERFCQLYAGKHFGNGSQAYREAGYKPKSADVSRNEASRLLANVGVWDRIQYLRNMGIAELAIDRRRILELRMKAAYDKDEPWPARLAALRDIEKALGLDSPTKLEISGDIDIKQSVITFVHRMENENRANAD